MDWSRVDKFTKAEFLDNTDLAEPRLFYALNDFRHFVAKPIHPSPVPGSLARLYGSPTSRHYAVGRKSDAVDVFVEAPPAEVLMLALAFRRWGGVGVYFDTEFRGQEWTMFHLDLRPCDSKVVWFRRYGVYHTVTTNRGMVREMFELLAGRER